MPDWMPDNPYPKEAFEQNLAYAEGSRDTALKIAEWLFAQCPESNGHEDKGQVMRHYCPECMLLFREESGLGEQLRREVGLTLM